MSTASPRRGLLAAFAVLAGIIVGAVLLKPQTITLASGTLLKTPREIVDFSLADASGQPFTKASLAGHWTVVFPGFTFCPDVCPTTLATLKAVLTQLDPAEAAALRVVLLSVDPKRDVPEKLGAYVHAFSPDFIGVSGSTAELDRLGASIGFVYTKVPGATPETYTIDHSAELILIGPDQRLHGYMTPPYHVPALVADLKTLLSKLPARTS